MAEHAGSRAMARQGFVNYSKEWWHFSLPGAGGQAYDFPIQRAAIESLSHPGSRHDARHHSRPTRSSTSRRRSRTSICLRSTGRWSKRSPPMAALRRSRNCREFGKHWGSAAMAARGRARQREHAKAADLRFPRQPARRGRVSSGLSRVDGAQRPCRRAQFDLDRRRQAGRRRAAEVVRAAKFYIASQVETGHLCPITMTRASVAALAEQPDLLAKVMPVHRDARL